MIKKKKPSKWESKSKRKSENEKLSARRKEGQTGKETVWKDKRNEIREMDKKGEREQNFMARTRIRTRMKKNEK